MDRHAETQHKLGLVRELLAGRGLDGVLIGSWANFAWITAGGDNHVSMGSPIGVGSVLVTRQAAFCLTNNIEAERLGTEELAGLGIDVEYGPWPDEPVMGLAERLCPGKLAVENSLADEIARLRWTLVEPEIARYRQVGRIASEALAATGREIAPGMTEHEICALLSQKVLAAGAVPATVLIATDERIDRYRHPIPTDKRLEKRAMIVLGAHKWGLVISATRMIHFGPVPEELADKHRAACTVDACLNLGTRPGARVSEVFAAAVAMYRATGYAEQWRLHHQGGATGYAARDYKGTLTCPETVLPNQAFAWNPSITGTKSEDTIIAREDSPEFLSSPINWPTLEVEYGGVRLERAAMLER